MSAVAPSAGLVIPRWVASGAEDEFGCSVDGDDGPGRVDKGLTVASICGGIKVKVQLARDSSEAELVARMQTSKDARGEAIGIVESRDRNEIVIGKWVGVPIGPGQPGAAAHQGICVDGIETPGV